MPRTARPAPRTAPRRPRRRVISAAIAVLIVAFLGALMWVGFQQIWANAGGADERADHPDRRAGRSRRPGNGTLSAAIGLTVAFTMLLGTVQVVARLHRTTVVTALATDAAHRVAEQGEGDVAEAARLAG